MTWRVNEPLGSTNISTGAGYIRQNNQSIQDTIGIDHAYMGQTNAGKHKKVTLTQQSSVPTTISSEGALYTKDSGGQPELFYREESDGDIVQITKAGSVGPIRDLTATSGDNTIKMSTNNASTKVSFKDSSNVQVGYIDSDGNASFNGNVAVTGNSTVTGTSTTGSSTVNGNLTVTGNLNVTGSGIPIKAWASFYISGTIRSSSNVSSITVGGTDYTINFTTPMPNTNYGVLISCGYTGVSTDNNFVYRNKLVGSVTVRTASTVNELTVMILG